MTTIENKIFKFINFIIMTASQFTQANSAVFLILR